MLRAMMDPSLTSITYALGGLTVSAVAVASGLRLLTFRRALQLQLAMQGREIPDEVAIYLGFSTRALHFTAGWFCLAVLADLAISRLAPSPLLAGIVGYTSVVGIFACGLALVLLASADFRVKATRTSYRVMQIFAGCVGIGIAVLGAVAMLQWGKLWQTPIS